MASRWGIGWMVALGMLLTASPGRCASGAAADSVELTRLLDGFLAGAGRNDPEVHERFWSEDLIYTGSGGRRVGKQDIMTGVRAAPPPRPSDPVTVYSAEDVQIRHLGDVALVAFQLVATTRAGEAVQVARFLNTGTFLWRDNRWQAVGWQATRMPLPEPESRASALAAAVVFGRALADADTVALANVTLPAFAWSPRRGDLRDRGRFLAEVAARKVRADGWVADSSATRLHGEVAIVRGHARRRGGAFSLTLVRDGAEWRALALGGVR